MSLLSTVPYIRICGGVIVCGTRETGKEQMRVVARAGDERHFQNPRTRRTSQSPSRNIRGGRQWRPIAYISPVSRCSRLLITREFRPRTRVINGSGPSPGYRGTKLRANLPQPYINPDFLTLLSQRSPSSSSFPPPPPLLPHAGFPPPVQYNEPRGMHHPVSIIRSPASNQIILKSAPHIGNRRAVRSLPYGFRKF